MAVKTGPFARDLKKAAGLVANFGRSAGQDSRSGLRLLQAGMGDMARGLGDLGTVAVKATSRAASLAGVATAKFLRTDTADYMRAAVAISLEKVAAAYGGLGKLAGRAIARGAGPALAAANKVADRLGEYYLAPLQMNARTTVEALAYTFGGLGKLAGRAILRRSGPMIAAIGAIRRRMAPALDFAASVAGRVKLPDISPLFQGAGGGILATARGLGVMAVGAVKAAAGLALVGRGLAKLTVAGAAAGLRAIGSAAMFTGRAFVNTFRFAEQLAAKLAILGAIGGAALYKTARAASDLAEQADMLRVTFGQGVGDRIAEQAKVMGEAFGTSRAEFMGSVGAIGGQLKGMGYAADDAAKLGVSFTKLAMDMASVKQISNEEAMTRMASGLSGEMEAVKRWGVDLSEANLKIEAVNRGIAKQGAELNQTQKVQLRAILMDEKLSYAKGNLAQTMGGAENATKSLMGRIENLAAQIGTALLPIVGAAMAELSVGVQVLSMLWSDWTRGVVNEQVGVVGSVGVTTESVGYLQQGVVHVADAWTFVKGVFYTVQSYITSGLGKMVEAVGFLIKALDYARVKMGYAKSGYAEIAKAQAEDLKRLSEEQFNKAGQALTGPSAAAGVGEFFKKAQDRIAAMRTEAMKPGVNPADFKPTGAAGPVKAGETKFASAALAGSQEAASAILKSQFGGGGAKQPEQETAKNTRRMADALDRLALGRDRGPIEIKGLPSGQMAATGFLGAFF